MPSSVSAHRLSGASVTSAPHSAWSKPPSTYGDEGVLAGVPARAVAAVVAEGDRLGERDVEPERPGHRRGHLGHLEGVGEPRALVVVGEHEDLRLAGQPAERRGVEDAVAVALEARAPLVGLLGPGPVAGADGPRGASSPAPRCLALLAGQPVEPGRSTRGARVGVGDSRTPPPPVAPSIVDAQRSARSCIDASVIVPARLTEGVSHRVGSVAPSVAVRRRGPAQRARRRRRSGLRGVPARGSGGHRRPERRRRRQGRRRVARRRPQRRVAAGVPRPPAPPGHATASTARARTSTAGAASDLEVIVPEGTVVKDLYTGEVLAELLHDGDRWLAAAGGRGGRGNARFLTNQRRAPKLRRAGRARRGALAQARAAADGRRGPRRLPERRQEHADQRDLGGQAEDRRLPVHHARAEPRRRPRRRRHRVRRRRHPRPDRGRQRGPGPRPPVPAPRRAGPGAVPARRPRRPRRHQPGRAGADPARRAAATTGPSCSTGHDSSSARRPTSRRPPIRPSSASPRRRAAVRHLRRDRRRRAAARRRDGPARR